MLGVHGGLLIYQYGGMQIARHVHDIISFGTILCQEETLSLCCTFLYAQQIYLNFSLVNIKMTCCGSVNISFIYSQKKVMNEIRFLPLLIYTSTINMLSTMAHGHRAI